MQLLKSEYYELPTKYNRTVIRLLVQSPTRMFAYWEVSEDTIKNFNKNNPKYGDCIAVLKVTNLTKNYSYNIPVNPYADNYYIDVDDPGCKYQVELGRMAKKKFVNLYTSNVASVPANHPATPLNVLQDEILFANYLCIGDKRKIKLYGDRQQYRHFENQNHTAFERKRFLGSSESEFGFEFPGSSDLSMRLS